MTGEADPLTPGMARIYTKVRHEGAIIHVGTRRYIIDSVALLPGEPGCDDDAIAHLTELPDDVGL